MTGLRTAKLIGSLKTAGHEAKGSLELQPAIFQYDIVSFEAEKTDGPVGSGA